MWDNFVNPEVHRRRQFVTTSRKFHRQFLDFFTAMAKAKNLVRNSEAQDLERVSLALFRFSKGG